MVFLVLRAYIRLIFFDPGLRRRQFSTYLKRVGHPLGNASHSIEHICHAVDIACICYWKQVFCLQRSAATTSLLRHYGIAAETVIGVRQMPFRSHAWVELHGRVVNDKPYIPEIYDVLSRQPLERRV
jgi:Transglutaminase-like superfamily